MEPNMVMRKVFLPAAAAAMIIVLASPSFAGSIVGSKHDFSTSGTASTPYAGVWETPGADGFPRVIEEICVFCHTPHGASKSVPGLANAPLWNRTNSPPAGYSYSMYSSATFSGQATINTAGPTGISMMCMSCHDGVTSIAVNTLLNAPGSGNPTINTNGIDPPGALGQSFNDVGFLGWGPNIGGVYQGGPSTVIDLSNDHPVSFNWPSGMTGTKLYDPTSIDSRLRLFGGPSLNRIECATCHQVHDPVNPPFLAMPNDNSLMCRSCHIK